ncbi:MAG: ribonuclease HI [Rikenellaceae bacterium]|nr:ribonuclease HI [Rikenellaceae bacterium]
MAHDVTIYTDGSALGNPGKGGYGIVMVSGKYRKEISQGYILTTNNRMELLAVIVALKHLKYKKCNVTIYSDSKYVVDSVSKGWLANWCRTGFRGKKNSDLWRRFIEVSKDQNVEFKWVKGHADNPGNIRCDQLAVEAANSDNLLEDKGYNPEIENNMNFE